MLHPGHCGHCSEPIFLTFLHKLFHDKRLAHIILNKVHLILTLEYYRPLLRFLDQLRQIAVQFLLLTATMPLIATAQLLQKLQILPTAIKLICGFTTQSNIVYSQFKIDSRDSTRLTFADVNGRSQNIMTFILDYSEKLLVGDHKLVYCLTKYDAKSLVG
jgi:hypothetical protein